MREKAAFNLFINWVLLAEGKYADDKNDRGGVTDWGISQRFKDQIGWVGEVSREQAIEIYRQYFWLGWRCDQMHPLVAWCACDAFIQHPPKSAALMVQEGLGVSLDGIIGPNTLKSAQSPNLLVFWKGYRLARIRFYNDIVANDDSQEDFIDGWHERLHKLVEGMYFAGLIGRDEAGTGFKSVILSPSTKAAGAGITIGGIVVALQSVGIDTTDAVGWAQEALPAGGLLGLATAWLARMNLKQG